MTELSGLKNDGDTVTLENGDMLRLRVETDCEPIGNLRDHGDVWGDTSEYAYDYHHDGHTPRPDGFTGNAEKIQVDRGYWKWWEPPADVPRSSEHFAAVRQNVRDLLQYGFQNVGLELCRGEDAYGRPIVVDVAWLGGVEPFADAEYLASIVSDLYAELDQ